MLSGADEQDRRLARRDGGEGAASLRRAVHLGEDHPREADRLVEGGRARPGALAHRGVQHQDRLVGLEHGSDLLELVNERGIETGTSGGIDDDRDVRRELLESFADDHLRTRFASVGIELATDLRSELLELVDGRGPMDVGRYEADAHTSLLEVAGQLAGGGRLSLPEQPGQEDPPRTDIELPVGTEDPSDLIVDDANEEVAEAGAGGRLLLLGPAANPLRELQRELYVHVRLQQRPLDVANDLAQQGVIDRRAPGDLLEDAAEGFSQRIKHHLPTLRLPSVPRAGASHYLWGDPAAGSRASD